MEYHFRNLIFEGGGVKGVAYLGAMQVLEEKGILANIRRVGGTSAGAINATLVALGFTNAEQKQILYGMDFKRFMDNTFGVLRDIDRLINKFGWNKGDFFHNWLSGFIKEKLRPDATLKDLKEAGKPDLYVYGTNLSTHFGEVFSFEHTPTMRIADAVRISMSIPLFFAAVRNARNDVYVDGGMLSNYPIKIFDREKHIEPKLKRRHGRVTDYYKVENDGFLKTHPDSSPYTYNKETLGFRLDSAKEIAVFRYGAEPQHEVIDDFIDYTKALAVTMLDSQSSIHLHSDDWQRTVYIDTLGVSTTDFGLSDETKLRLENSGRKGTEDYFNWYDTARPKPANKP